jgi:hypothetical protein
MNTQPNYADQGIYFIKRLMLLSVAALLSLILLVGIFFTHAYTLGGLLAFFGWGWFADYGFYTALKAIGIGLLIGVVNLVVLFLMLLAYNHKPTM